jgi:hypothetical protein
MPKLVVNGAKLTCSEGLSPSTLTVVPFNRPLSANQPAATVADRAPFLNVMPFGLCKSLANPQVASATAAASGSLTPMPCIPIVLAPWSPGCSSSESAGSKILSSDSRCVCLWSGEITVSDPASDIEV